MGELPVNIKKWDDNTLPILLQQLVESSNQQNSILQAMYELMRGGAPETETEEDMPIPLNVELFAKTDKSDLPFQPYIENYSSFNPIAEKIIDSKDSIIGYRFGYLKSFQPKQEYNFNLNIETNFTNFHPETDNPIKVYLYDKFLFGMVYMMAFGFVYDMGTGSSGGLDAYLDYYVSHLNSRSLITELPVNGGTFSINPSNNDALIYISGIDSQNDEHSCVITSFEASTNTFTLGGY